MTMTATHWLLLAIIIFCGMCLFAIFVARMINTEWPNADKPEYRTADGKAIEKQTQAIYRGHIPPRPFPAPAPSTCAKNSTEQRGSA